MARQVSVWRTAPAEVALTVPFPFLLRIITDPDLLGLSSVSFTIEPSQIVVVSINGFGNLSNSTIALTSLLLAQISSADARLVNIRLQIAPLNGHPPSRPFVHTRFRCTRIPSSGHPGAKQR